MTPQALATQLVDRYGLTAADLVIEIGSGEGEFLRAVRQLGPRVLGIETDAVRVSRAFAAGIDTVRAVFNPATAARVCRRYGVARVLIAGSPATAEPEFLAAAARCLTADGVVLLVGAAALAECQPVEPTLPRAA